ncbi:erythrocyte membrane protein 1, PfEMP1, putative [Plasmodium reichenowi]|uniref:Erythrocyte membrane protein 1, PfEMP1, putative n=1 Tax=Plasmodium reichenowi TaxID=5854 RepID=A0A2P9DBP9_PLARE|nr:erythrocyte membrane protein 1, PfEMP1, putative [Plasmodium reichenowi]
MGGDGGSPQDAKHVLDEIGQQVHDQVKKDAENYTTELQGHLSMSTILGEELNFTTDPCEIIKEKHDELIKSKGHPCGKNGEDVNRFSDKEGAECANNRIDGNIIAKGGKDFGACAPYRRLSLCNKNLENINNIDSDKARHNLLAEVCLAANFEGQSISNYYPQYAVQYPGSDFPMCTMLARSFADIGDIVRGRDLYVGKRKKQNGKETEREKLEKKLKEYFQKVHDELTDSQAQKRYNDTTDFFQLREDWWNANRHTVWKALTCKAPTDASYFRVTCNDDGTFSQANHQCRCTKSRGTNADQVPTYFDYVPQFLRWFEEWAEDFCRRKKRKLEDVKKSCREKDGNDRYCSRNGYDCEQTVRARGKLRYGKGCTDCFFACHSYESWIENQRKQFDKQRNKYQDEISGNGRRRRVKTKYDGYEKKFYDEFKKKGNYGDVYAFLDLLNNEKTCKAVEDEKGGKINFKTVNSGSASGGKDASDTSGTNNEKQGTFYRSKYCQPCPHCGVEKVNNEWTEKSKTDKCTRGNLYKPNNDAKHTPIKILKSGDGEKDIAEKLDNFCKTQNGSGGAALGDKNSDGDSQKLYEEWKCYQFEQLTKVVEDDEEEDDVEEAGGLCILPNLKKKEKEQSEKEKSEDNTQKEPAEFQKTFNDFFNFWVAHMLKDSIYWRTEKLKGCLQNGNRIKCRSRCKEPCDCYERWVQKKKKDEWDPIKEHFGKQKKIKEETGADPIKFLEFVLQKDVLLTSIKEGYGNEEDIKHIQDLFEQTGVGNSVPGGSGTTGPNGQNNTIDKLLKREGDEADKCKNCQEPQPQDKGGGARSESFDNERTPAPVKEEEESDEEDFEEEELENEDDQDEVNGSQEEGSPPKEDNVNVCNIVNSVLTSGDLGEACRQKYQYGKERYTQWRCVTPTKPNGDSTSQDGDQRRINKRSDTKAPSGSSSSGSICIPPRRRKLYTKKIEEWAATVNGNKEVGSNKVSVSESGGSGGDKQTESSQSVSSSSTSATASGSPRDPLLAAFVESAAVETFFLWHQYKQLNGKSKTPQEDGVLPLVGVPSVPVVPPVGARATVGEDGLQEASSTFGEPTRSFSIFGSDGSLYKSMGNGMTSLQQQGLPPPFPQSPLGLADATLTGSAPFMPGQLPGSITDSDNSDNPETSLKQGKIPNDFLKQMFYTLGDYRDILVGNTPEGIDEVIRASEKDKEGQGSDKDSTTKLTVKQISTKIKEIIEKPNGDTSRSTGGNNPSLSGRNHHSSVKPGTSSGKSPPNSDKRSTLWETTLGPAVWNGMICALTYTDTDPESGPKGADGSQSLQQIDKADTILAQLTGTYGNYNDVKLEDESDGTRPKRGSSHSDDTPLDAFVKRPPYFRYLEEWGDTFCRERAKRLGQIYKECKVGDNGDRRGNGKKCSGFGEHCDDNLFNNSYDTIPSLDCPRCAEECRKYRKWIGRKRTEYEKQRNAYEQQKKEYSKQKEDAERNNHGNGFYKNLLENNKEAKDFLKTLGACSKKDDDSRNNKPIFEDIEETFGHENYCDPCSEFKINCKENGNCSKDKETECKSKNKNSIAPKDIETIGTPTYDISMLVSDDSKRGNGSQNGLETCREAHIFKGIRKDEWKCGKVCGYNVCKPKNGNGKPNGDKHIITIRALVAHWVYNFLQDYNKIKHKISHCINNGQNKCKCNDKCKCVNEWITEKKGEWQKIKERYLDQYKNKDDEYYPVKSALEEFQERPEFKEAIKPCSLDNFKKSCGLNSDESSKKSKDGTPKDLVECLLDKLQQKAEKCEQKHKPSGEPGKQCDTTSHSGNTLTLVGDDDSLEEEENQVKAPKICPKIDTKEDKVDEDGEECKPASDTSVDKEEDKEEQDGGPSTSSGGEDGGTSETPEQATEDSGSEQTPVLKPEEEVPLPAPKEPQPDKTKTPSSDDKKTKQRQTPRTPQLEDPNEYKLRDVLLPSAFPLTVGLSFLALSYWFLKKKTKSPVDLFSVIDIPKGEYGMPTKLSPNRYIPYKSAQYRGKRYIYLEGDTDEDKYMFMSDTTDVTSSESEYEEIDINDIYPYQSPKYKTLIEVVLEPSKRDTQNDIQSDDIPSDTPPPITDEEWNELKNDFISNMLQNTQNKQPNIVHDNVDNNTHPNPSHNKLDQKPFIMSIHDRNLLSGEEYNYDMANSVDIPIGGNHGLYIDKNVSYSGIDLINDSLNSGNHDIYNELLKRKENELFGTNHHPKRTNTYSVAKNTNIDPIMNQLDLFHKWLDRHRNMCQKWDKNKVEMLDKLKELWISDTPHTPSDIHPSGKLNDIPSSNKMLNTDASIQIDMYNPKTKNEFKNIDTNPDNFIKDTILNDLEKYNEPYYDVQDDIYYDVYDDDKTSVDHINMDYNKMDNNNSDVPTKVQIEMSVKNTQMMEEKYPMSDIWNI